jgi:hypothetical protein
MSSGMTPWPFDQPQNFAAITTKQVLESGLPILTVVHYSDDHSWAFLCGNPYQEKDGRVIAMSEALEMDPTLRDIADLQPGWIAWRQAVGSPWQRKENDSE